MGQLDFDSFPQLANANLVENSKQNKRSRGEGNRGMKGKKKKTKDGECRM
jgi:hypothetical protein